MGCLETLVRNEYPGRISVIAKLDNVFPIDRTKLSKTLPTEEEPLNLRSKDWFDGNAIEFIWGTVGRVDFKKKTVMTDRRQTYEYTKLVIATGGKPKTISLPGFESEDDALLLRTLDDARKIKTAVGNGKKKVAIIGSSFIGLELANALSADHIVTVIGQTSAPLSHVLGEQIGDAIKRLLEKRGVRIVTRVNVSCLLGNERFPGTKFIQMKGVPGFLAADLVILAIGVVPVTDFIAKGDVGLLPDGSVKVDHHFRVVGVEDAYAVGDIATFPYWGPGAGMKSDNVYTRIEHWDVAQNSGRAVGDHIAYILENSEGEKPPKEFVPIFWSALGQQLRYCGSTLNGYDDILIRSEQPSPDTTKFVAFYTLSDTVVAVASMNWDPVVMKCVTLMKARKMPKKVDLQRGLDVMDIPI
ncbi:hypothetical protein KEM54_001755 [Ascosphaera aggregata]|nr:hypothetical protein KEM54_001755 [Ascosphaera aggregata]